MYALIITELRHLASPQKMNTLVLLVELLSMFVCKGLIIEEPWKMASIKKEMLYFYNTSNWSGFMEFNQLFPWEGRFTENRIYLPT
jgi:hypothetical protein